MSWYIRKYVLSTVIKLPSRNHWRQQPGTPGGVLLCHQTVGEVLGTIISLGRRCNVFIFQKQARSAHNCGLTTMMNDVPDSPINSVGYDQNGKPKVGVRCYLYRLEALGGRWWKD